MLWNSHSEGK